MSGGPSSIRLLRIYHSAVVGAWRDRDRALRELGVEETLISASRWNEGGQVVELVPEAGEPVVGARTLGHHPYLFLYDPRPLWRALRHHRIDVLDVHEEPASLAAAEVLLLARLAGCRAPVCLYSAQNIPKRYPWPFRWFERMALRRAAAVHTCNDAAGTILRAKGFTGRIVNLGLGVDLDRFGRSADLESRRASGRGADRVRLDVGYVGRLEPHKGVGALVAAVAATPDVGLAIVGDGPDRVRLVEAIAASGAAERIALPGFCPTEELPVVYAGFDVVVVPSIETPSWIEQFGRVAVEAMASGAAVVASDSGSLPEVLGGAGVLVPPGDVAALGEALRSLRDDAERRGALGAAGRARASRYSWPEVARRQLELYRTMIEDQR